MVRASVLVIAAVTTAAVGDNWVANITVDNQYDIYFGTSNTTTFQMGGDANWPTTETWTASGRPATDYLYVATASDQSVAQGFLGEFTNVTQGFTIKTGSPLWQVFPAGAHLQTLFGMSGAWTPGTQPTQTQVDAAINYATNNNLWITPSTFANWDNRAVGNMTIWGTRPGIANDAEWIWHNKFGTGNPFSPGVDHDEFLVFRVAGVPAPGAGALIGLVGLAAARRRRA